MTEIKEKRKPIDNEMYSIKVMLPRFLSQLQIKEALYWISFNFPEMNFIGQFLPID